MVTYILVVVIAHISLDMTERIYVKRKQVNHKALYYPHHNTYPPKGGCLQFVCMFALFSLMIRRKSMTPFWYLWISSRRELSHVSK